MNDIFRLTDKARTAPLPKIPSNGPATRHGDFMDLKMREHVTRNTMKDRIRELDYLLMHDNNATIPLLATEVAVRKVQAEMTEILAKWREGK
jgi:hypothetical protein